MFRRGFAVLVTLTMSAHAEDSSFKDGIINDRAEVLAFVDLCDFRFNEVLANTALSALGINLDENDEEDIRKMSGEMRSRLSKYDRKALCLAGEIMYGPEGLSTPDMISTR